ncbi:hypothetical protein DICPUDRAFT_150981 [Dictyostelium purpureum]|uniref:RING-type domain-containing protein n=1 Tax=Dictyostelium purpureum TaxID=5786 RepID=F0ZHQ6_DICPU|nr:uncharacterized protein DICPUDRAFT_150981 [Dictyostelium purpureum]EGC36517.1 hypothetical protein DICPUDRAFT_150981 [Dictyostelium purpureum]|eukprot:XP_003286962.1 hypothetical protein DICPUDRAFT_150981 [Dictyostelium purpureum]
MDLNNSLILNSIENEYNDIFQIPLELLVEDQEGLKDLTCAICLQLLQSPSQCSFGHMFCLACIEKSIKKSPQCPVCRGFLNMKILSRSLFVERTIGKLKVYCRYRFKVEPRQKTPLKQLASPTSTTTIASDSSSNNSSSNSVGNSGIVGAAEPDFSFDLEGCNHTDSLENISNHEKTCIYRFEKCKYNINYLNNIGVSGIVVSNLNSSSKSISISDTNSVNNSPNNKSPRVVLTNSPGSDNGNSNDNNGSSVNIKKLKQDEKNKIIISTSIKSASSPKSCSIIRFKDLEKHYEVCPYRPVLCGYCKTEFYDLKIKEHEENCEMRKVECEKCKSQVAKKELKLHLSDSCPNQTIKCTFGCDKEFERKDLIDHLNESIAIHMVMMKQQHQNEISSLKKEFNLQMASKEDKIKSLEKTLRERVLDSKIKVEWRIKNYLECKKAGYVQSEKFIIKGFSFFIGFFVDGDSNDSKGYISIYLFLDTTDIQKGKSLSLDFSLKFTNQKDQNQSLQREYKHIGFPLGSDGQGWGDRRSIKTSILESAGFIKDNSLLIASEITVKKEFYQVEESSIEKH